MKLNTITRTVSGSNYDNISVSASLDDGDDFVEKAKVLDLILKKSLDAIKAQNDAIWSARNEKVETISLLQNALDYAKKNEIPF